MAAQRPVIETLGENFGYAFSVEDAYIFIREFETKTTSKFTSYRTDKGFGAIDYTKRSHRICWEDQPHVKRPKISFTGVPFIYLGCKIYDCQHGMDRKAAAKQKRQQAAETGNVTSKKCPKAIQRIPKLNCTARIKLREILMFPDFKIDKNTMSRRRLSSARLRAALKKGTANPERRIYIEFPSNSDHQNHLVGEVGRMCPTVDKRETNRTNVIHELVAEGLKDVNQVRHELELSMASDQPSSSIETLHVSLTELPIENVSIDTTNADLFVNTNAVLSEEGEGQKCRDLLEQIKQLTFVIQDKEVLGRLNSRLQGFLEGMQLFCCVRQSENNSEVHEDISTLQQETFIDSSK
ncbi:hypothetical protein ACROYT_G042479 [Oculina patagonica]